MNTSATNILSLDTEDDSKGNVTYINFFNGDSHKGFYTSLEAIDFLMFSLDAKKVYIIFALNAMYDLANIFQSHMSLIHIWLNGSKFIKAKMIDRKIWFYDVSCYTKYSVKKLGDLVGLPKMSRTDDVMEDYCERDTEIVYRFVEYLQSLSTSLGLNGVRATLPSMALKSFLVSREIPKRPSNRVVGIIRRAYHGGLNDCFQIGIIHGQITEYDVNSMYPFIMLGAFPDPSTYYVGKSISRPGVMCCRVEVPEMFFPILGIVKDERYIFPVGVIEGLWTTDELRYAESLGCRIERVYGGINFRHEESFFEEWIQKIYKRRLDAVNEVEKFTWKIMLNSLYGKFAEKGESIFWDGHGLKRYTSKSGDHVNVIWSAVITARARVYLHRLSTSCDGLLYTDTDSMIYSRGDHFETSNDLGGVKIAFQGKQIEIQGCKEYRIIGSTIKLVQKGIPQKYAKRFFETGRAEFKRPSKFLESIRDKMPMNIWDFVVKEKQEGYVKRTICDGGYTIPQKVCHLIPENEKFFS